MLYSNNSKWIESKCNPFFMRNKSLKCKPASQPAIINMNAYIFIYLMLCLHFHANANAYSVIRLLTSLHLNVSLLRVQPMNKTKSDLAAKHCMKLCTHVRTHWNRIVALFSIGIAHTLFSHSVLFLAYWWACFLDHEQKNFTVNSTKYLCDVWFFSSEFILTRCAQWHSHSNNKRKEK